MAKEKSDHPCAITGLVLRASFKNILYAVDMSLMSRRNFLFERADVSRRLWTWTSARPRTASTSEELISASVDFRNAGSGVKQIPRASCMSASLKATDTLTYARR